MTKVNVEQVAVCCQHNVVVVTVSNTLQHGTTIIIMIIIMHASCEDKVEGASCLIMQVRLSAIC